MPKFPQELDDALRPPPPSFFGLKPPAPGKPHLARKDIAVPELEYSDEEELKPEAPRMLKMLAAARSNGLRNARPLQEPPPAAALAVSAQSPHSIAANFAGSLLSGAATSASSAMVVAAAAASDQLEQAAAALEAPSLPSEITEVGARSAADELPSLAEAEEPNEPNEPNEPTPDEPYRDEA